MNPDDLITVRQAFSAMHRFLDTYWERTRADEVAVLLGGLSLLPDGGPADPATWTEWMRAVEDVREGRADARLTLKSE